MPPPLPGRAKKLPECVPKPGRPRETAMGNVVRDRKQGRGCRGTGDDEQLSHKPEEVDKQQVEPFFPVAPQGPADDRERPIHNALAFCIGRILTRLLDMVQSRAVRPHRLEDQDTGLSSRRQGFESPWGHSVKGLSGERDAQRSPVVFQHDLLPSFSQGRAHRRGVP